MLCPQCHSKLSPLLLERFGFSRLKCSCCGSTVSVAYWASLIILLVMVPATLWFGSQLHGAIAGPFFRGATAVAMGLSIGAVIHAAFLSFSPHAFVPAEPSPSGWLAKPSSVLLVLLFAAHGAFLLFAGVET
jgi:hypothetical protein